MKTETAGDKLRASAAQHERNAHESFERCDTDGFVSQWASGLNAQKDRLAASIADAGGVAEFPALFDLDGNLVAAKLIDGRYGLVWGILASDDPHSDITKWVTAFPARESTMRNKGYREGFVMAPAAAKLAGGGKGLAGAANVRAIKYRTDGGFSRTSVEV